MRKGLIAIAIITLSVFTSCDWLAEIFGANDPPVADAGADLVAGVGDIVPLDGSGSTDSDGDVLEFAWDFTGYPPGQTIPVISNPSSQLASFAPDAEGDYIARLTVDDGIATHSDTVSISVGPGTANVDPNVALTYQSVTDGQMNAPIDAFVILEFNTAMDWVTFDGVVTFSTAISQDFIALTFVPDPNLNVIWFQIPSQLVDSGSGNLFSNETYTMTVPSTVLTAAGLGLPADIVITFTTFTYGQEHDDSAVITGETWDIAYHSVSNTLLYLGETATDFVVRRYSLGTGLATTELTNASTQVLYGGMDLWDNTLYVNESYDSEVTEYPVNADGSLAASTATYGITTLAAPADTLSEVLNTAKIGANLYFTTGNWHGGASFQDIIKFDGAVWSTVVTGSVHGFNNDEAKNIVALNVGGTDYIYLAEPVSDKLYKFRESDGALVTSITFTEISFDAELDFDLSNNIYLGTQNGIYQFSADLVLLDQRGGVDAGRIAVKDSGGNVSVYFIDYRNPTIIGYVNF